MDTVAPVAIYLDVGNEVFLCDGDVFDVAFDVGLFVFYAA